MNNGIKIFLIVLLSIIVIGLIMFLVGFIVNGWSFDFIFGKLLVISLFKSLSDFKAEPNEPFKFTDNKALDLSLAPAINFNTSDFSVNDSSVTECKTIFKFDLCSYDEDNTILCNGDCNLCPYCKSRHFNQTILFKAHGGSFDGLDSVNEYFLAYLDYKKQFDYGIYLRIKNAEVNTSV